MELYEPSRIFEVFIFVLIQRFALILGIYFIFIMFSSILNYILEIYFNFLFVFNLIFLFLVTNLIYGTFIEAIIASIMFSTFTSSAIASKFNEILCLNIL